MTDISSWQYDEFQQVGTDYNDPAQVEACDSRQDHIRQEYSTYDWIMEGLLPRAGFAIKDKQIVHGVIGTYHCVKTT